MAQRPDLMTITMPEKIKTMLEQLEKDEETSKSKIIHQLILRQYHLQRNRNVAVWRVVQSFESDMLTLAATRKISGDLYAEIYEKHIKKIKEIIKREYPEIQQSENEELFRLQELDRQVVKASGAPTKTKKE